MKYIAAVTALFLATSIGYARECGYVNDGYGNTQYICVDSRGNGNYRYDNWDSGNTGNIRDRGNGRYSVQDDNGSYSNCRISGSYVYCN